MGSYMPDESLNLRPLLDISEDTKANILDRGVVKYKTGLTDLDEILWGLHKKEVMTVGARTSQGKSAFVTHILCNLGGTGARIINFTNEMTEEQMCERLITNICGINNLDLREGKAKQELLEKYNKFTEWAKNTKILITNKYGRRFYEAIKVIEKIQPDFIIIDYIQMVTGTGEKRQVIEDFLIRIGEMAKDMDFGVISISQINRTDAGGRPYMHNLKWSGVLEEFSDTVLLLHWDYENDRKYYIYVEKQRHGATGKVEVTFYPEYNRFEDKENYGQLQGLREIKV